MADVSEEEGGSYPKIAHVGLYWFVLDNSQNILLMAHRCSLADAEEYGDFLTCPHGHYEIWESWRSGRAAENADVALYDAEYEEWPRGRVVFNAVKGQFTVYADGQIAESELRRIVEHFGIAAERTVFMKDEHYKSTRLLRMVSGGDREPRKPFML